MLLMTRMFYSDIGGISCEVLSGLVTLIIFKKNNELSNILFNRTVRLSVVEAIHGDENFFILL
jgi:hypothetical protein